MKKLYEKPTVELVVFNYADVMAASGDPISTWLIDDYSPTENPTGAVSEDPADWISPISSEPVNEVEPGTE